MILIGRKDTLTKEYMSRNDIFADVFNYFLYHGQSIINQNDLVDRDISEIALPLGKDDKIVPVQKYRDILKGLVVKESSDTIYALLGIENQSEIHYAMPVRNLLYDTLNYASQVSKKSAKSQQNIVRQEKNNAKKEIIETLKRLRLNFYPDFTKKTG